MTDRRLSSRVAAEYVGLPDSTWRAYVTRGTAPPADGHDDGFDMDYWLQSKLDEWMEGRPGHGGRPRKTPQEDLEANPELVEQMERTAADPDSRVRRGRPKRGAG